MMCRHANKSEIEKICYFLAAEFSSDPVHQIIFPDPDSRVYKLRDFFFIYINLAIEHGGILLSEDCSGALVYFFPGKVNMTDEENIAFDIKLRHVCGSSYATAKTLINGLDHYHPKTPPHYFISLLAVKSELRGGRIVKELFSAMNSILDNNNAPCYAECTRFSTRTLIRRWGYHDYSEPLQIENFPELYPVWRDPRSN